MTYLPIWMINSNLVIGYKLYIYLNFRRHGDAFQCLFSFFYRISGTPCGRFPRPASNNHGRLNLFGNSLVQVDFSFFLHPFNSLDCPFLCAGESTAIINSSDI